MYFSKEDCIRVFLTQHLKPEYPLEVRKKELKRQFDKWGFPEFSDIHGAEFELLNDMSRIEFLKLLDEYKEREGE